MNTRPEPDLASELLALEIALATRDLGALPGGVERVLDDAFVEVGASGRRWTRDETIDALRGAPPAAAVITEFELAGLAPDLVLVTYAIGPGPGAPGRTSRRTSIWIRVADGWRLRFHQGTATGD